MLVKLDARVSGERRHDGGVYESLAPCGGMYRYTRCALYSAVGGVVHVDVQCGGRGWGSQGHALHLPRDAIGLSCWRHMGSLVLWPLQELCLYRAL